MKTIIISLPRSGSSSIVRYVEKITNTNEKIIYGEPFNVNLLKNNPLSYFDIIKNNNVFVKTMVNQKPIEFEGISIMEYYQKIKNDFDNVVLLDRLNIKEQSESYCAARMMGQWHGKYYYNEKMFMDWEPLSMNHIIDSKKIITNLSDFFNTKIYYYEDIYWDIEKMKNFLSVIDVEFNEEYYNDYLDLSKKYRIAKLPITSLI
jgi:hypothetical protein